MFHLDAPPKGGTVFKDPININNLLITGQIKTRSRGNYELPKLGIAGKISQLTRGNQPNEVIICYRQG
ncbi:MAG: hypothetical protein AB7V56_07235 [Candidatus Nitrosocosmicus sp.]|jgi:hypothetical protein